MNYGKQILLVILLLALFPAASLYAQNRYSEFERDLQLSESQKSQVEETKRRYMDELRGLNQEYINKRLELRQLDSNPSANKERRERLQRELGTIEGSRHNLFNQYRSEVTRALNQDQRDRYNNFVDTEQRRTMNRPVSPPMNRLSPPPVDQYTGHPAPRGVNPPSGPQYGPTPPMNRPQAPSSIRPPVTSPRMRGYGR